MHQEKKVVTISTELQSIPLKTPFITALRRVEDVVFVRVYIMCDDGSIGIGEAPATKAITGEDLQTIQKAIASVEGVLEGLALRDALRLLHLQTIGSSAKAALDIALMSLLGFCKLQNTQAIQTDITISLNTKEKMLRDAQDAFGKGMDILKVKLGKDIAHAIAVTQLLFISLPKAQLLIDANQAWDLESSLKYLDAVKNIPLALIEQPVVAHDLSSLKMITEATNIPILADEAVFTLEDVQNVIQTRSADMINIKLMKCGGVSKAIEILEYAREKGIVCMLGSMLEGPYSINTALYLAFNYRDVVRFVDLDSPLLYKEFAAEIAFHYDGAIINS